MICRIRLFTWRMQCCVKDTDPIYDWLSNVAVCPEEVVDLMKYIILNNCIRQSFRVDRALDHIWMIA